MTLVLLFLNEHGTPNAGAPAAPISTFAPAVHRKVGVRQPDVPSHGGGAGLAMWGWLRGLSLG